MKPQPLSVQANASYPNTQGIQGQAQLPESYPQASAPRPTHAAFNGSPTGGEIRQGGWQTRRNPLFSNRSIAHDDYMLKISLGGISSCAKPGPRDFCTARDEGRLGRWNTRGNDGWQVNGSPTGGESRQGGWQTRRNPLFSNGSIAHDDYLLKISLGGLSFGTKPGPRDFGTARDEGRWNARGNGGCPAPRPSNVGAPVNDKIALDGISSCTKPGPCDFCPARDEGRRGRWNTRGNDGWQVNGSFSAPRPSNVEN